MAVPLLAWQKFYISKARPVGAKSGTKELRGLHGELKNSENFCSEENGKSFLGYWKNGHLKKVSVPFLS